MINCLLQEALWSEKIRMQRKTVTCLPHFHKKPPTLYMAIMDICKFFIMILFLIPMEFSFLWIITCTLGTGMFLYMVKTRFWLMLKLRLYFWLIVQQCYMACIGLCKTDCQRLVSDGKDQLQWCTVLQVYCKPDI